MIITSQQFKIAYKNLPRVLREFIADDDLTPITEDIGQRYQLHVDTTGALYRETTNMLLGYINPEQFVGELKSVGVPQESIGAIVEELNTKVFIPLREKMKNAPPEEPDEDESDDVAPSAQPTQYSPPAPPQISYAQPAPEPVRQPLVQAPAYIPPTPVAPPAPAVPPASVSQFSAQPVYTPPPAQTSVPLTSVPPILPGQIIPPTPQPAAHTYIGTPAVAAEIPPPFVPSTPAAAPAHIVAPHARTMQEDMQNATNHTAAARPAPAPFVATPAPVAQPAPAPVTPPPSTLNQKNRDDLHEVLKSYGIDPYREPPE